MATARTPFKVTLGLLGSILVVWVVLSVRGKQDRRIEVSCLTSKGPLNLIVMPQWSPHGAERFLQLVHDGFFADLPLFRCMDKFICQFGSAPPRPGAKIYSSIPDDPHRPHLREFKKGYVSFAGSGPHSRSTHIFVALEAVKSLGAQPWETPFGYVSEESMANTVSRFTTTYGDSAPVGKGPPPDRIEASDGIEYLRRKYPDLDWIYSCTRK